MDKYREITAEQLKQGYRVFTGINPWAWESDDEPVSSERHEYKVIRKTDAGTYIVEEP